MSVNVIIKGADVDTDEYQAAVKLKNIIEDSIPRHATGEILLYASATLMGQVVKDIDLMMIGQINNYNVNAEFNDNRGNSQKTEVSIGSFCTTIEIKSHDISGISVDGTDFYVRYGREKHCVTTQSNKQKFAAKNFFDRMINGSPYITNIIWFTQATSNDINSLCMRNGKKMLSNVIGSDFDFKELMQLLFYQKPPYKTYNGFRFDSNNSCSINDIQKALNVFSENKRQMGELTRIKIEQISNRLFDSKILVDPQGKVSIYRGRAGTGKTIGLIQTAIRLVDEEQERVLILTYNKALVSDIRRLFALAELPDMFEEQCVDISTMHSYFYRVCNEVLYEGKLKGDKFIEKYEVILNSLKEFMKDPEGINLVREVCEENSELNWSYVLIDEAQDWSALERDIILSIFEPGKIIVADGGQQFVRKIDVCDWSVIKDRNNIKLKYCLRQKENLIKFLNAFTKKSDVLGGKILSNNNMLGGKIIVCDNSQIYDMHKVEIERLKKAGNIPYDMLYLVPHSLVKKEYGKSYFSEIKKFNDAGIAVWDGTCSENRDTYSVNTEEVRLLQYESSRGLEGWTVVCVEFDRFLELKEKEYIEGEVNALLLESPEERKKKYLYNWAMIPLTRAIDTLIITLKDKNSPVGELLLELAEEYPDYISYTP